MVIMWSLLADLLIAVEGLSSGIRTTFVLIRLLVANLFTSVEDLAHTTHTLSTGISTLSSNIGATLASIALFVENRVATTNVLALDMHYLLQGCIALVALLCLLTVICIVRWCYIFSRELRGVQHLKTA
ncbi:hypothetical protein BDR06DRAFT_1023559 [Suillus hirtellus]|nr:hypothetical protein BDR06DRAFT_1023559 [Suillus hirtellus]